MSQYVHDEIYILRGCVRGRLLSALRERNVGFKEVVMVVSTYKNGAYSQG